jgi:phage shock protein C
MTAESTAPAPTGPEPGASVRRLYRSQANRVLAGVCGGIAEYYHSDPTAVRLAALVIGLFTGIVPMVVLYIAAAIIVPEGTAGAGEVPTATRTPGQAALVLGTLLVLIGIAGFANVWLHIDWEQVWPIVVIGVGAAMVVAASRPRR